MRLPSIHAQRRHLLRWLGAHGAGLPLVTWAASPDAMVDAWVVLSLPELASLPREAAAERQALQARIEQQQDEVMAALRALGAVELARVQQLRNALAVRLPLAQVPAARAVSGVRAVQPVRDIDRGPPTGPTR
jgi:hypothetical protein